MNPDATQFLEPFATLTCSRGDRPQFFDFCMHQITRLTMQPKHTVIVNEPPKSNAADITLRIRKGLTAIKNLGIDIVYIIEDDDLYPKDYIEQQWIGTHDFIGRSKSLYYNLQNRTYNEFTHPGRSSLFCTGFRISALKDFDWPPDETVFLDILLWKHAIKKGNYNLIDKSIGVGIKHGVGKTAGIGHRLLMPLSDSKDMSFLKSKVDQDAMTFYKSL